MTPRNQILIIIIAVLSLGTGIMSEAVRGTFQFAITEGFARSAGGAIAVLIMAAIPSVLVIGVAKLIRKVVDTQTVLAIYAAVNSVVAIARLV